MRSGMTLLVTEQLTATPRLATAINESGADTVPGSVVLATFTPGRPPAAAIAARLGLVNRSLMASDAPTIEAMLMGACYGISAERVIVWNCPRAAAAFHALRLLEPRPSVEYILPRAGSSSWNESEIIATRVANLVDRFIVEDAATERLLLDIGVEARQIDRPVAFPDAPGRGDTRRAYIISEALDSRWSGKVAALRDAGFATTHATDAVIVAAALGWCDRTGGIVITDAAFDAVTPVVAAATNGWTVVDATGQNTGLDAIEPAEFHGVWDATP